MAKQLWETLVNAESKKGWWDITFADGGVKICKYYGDQTEIEISLSVALWKDLCELMNRLQEVQVSDTRDDAM